MNISYIDGKNDYFASSNTRYGFYTRFDSVFDRDKFDRVFIIKGGSGTGKSFFMKRIREALSSRRLSAEGVLCSSDPSSLDGLICRDAKLAFIDGTPPHTTDPVYPGAVDTIVDLGEFWSCAGLAEKRSEITKIVKEKKALFDSGYRLLGCAGDVSDDILYILTNRFDKIKARNAIERFFDAEISKKGAFSEEIMIGGCINAAGVGRTGFFENAAEKKCVTVNDDASFALFYSLLYESAKKRGSRICVSFDPLDPKHVDGVYFPDDSVSVTRCFDLGEWKKRFGSAYKIFNVDRFFRADDLRAVKNKLRLERKLRDDVISEACGAFAEAFALHVKLEKIYGDNMDFMAKDEFTERFISRICFGF